MPKIICPTCGTELTEYKRFCPECGARLPEPEESAPPPPPPAAAPTVLLPPDLAPTPPPPPPAAAPTVLLPPDVAPTARLDTPPAAAPTVLLPPDAPGVAPTARLDLPAAPPPEPEPPAPGAADTPTMLGGQAPPAYSGGLPTGAPYPGDPAPPPAFGGALPTGAPYPGGAASPPLVQGKRTIWWLVGGAGCLALVLVAACVVGILIFLGNAAADTVETAATEVSATSGPLGGGGIIPDNSPLTGGDVLLEDDFADADSSGLGVEEDEDSRYSYEGGAYVIEVKSPEMIVWTRVDGSYADARIELDAEVPPSADVSAAGLIFHYQDEDNFYLFSISNDGYYALELLQDNEWVVLIDWTESDAVDTQLNRLGVATKGDRIALYVNGELLEETSDGTFTDGEVALAVSSLKDSTAEVRFDNLLITQNE